MIKTLKELKLNHNYVADIDLVYGQLKGYFFTITNLERKNMICIVFSVNATETIITELSNLRRSYDAIPMGGVYKEGRELNVELNLLSIEDSKQFESILDSITSILKAHILVNVCSESGSNDDIGVYRVGTKVKIMSSHVFGDQKQTQQTNYGSKLPKSRILAWFAVMAIFIAMIFIKELIGSIFFLIPMAISAGALRLAVDAFDKLGGPIHQRQAKAIIALFVTALVLEPIVILSGKMMMMGFGLVTSLKITIASIFSSLEAFVNVYSNVPFNLAIALYACWGLFQQILGNARTGKRVSRKNTKLL